MNLQVVHLTSVHPRYDTRIFYRECLGLYKNGYEVALVVADGNGDETKAGISIFDVGKPGGRISRMIKTAQLVLHKAIELDGDIYHFHDPELIFVGLRLRKLGKRVIFDVHENITEQIKSKKHLPKPVRYAAFGIFTLLNRIAAKNFHLILAENSYEKSYKQLTKHYTVVLNMPQIEFFDPYVVNDRTGNEIFYIGGITENRGLYTILDALDLLFRKGVPFKMHFIGPTYGQTFDLTKYAHLEENIVFHGPMPLDEGYTISKNASVGISILKPIKNYLTSYSTKIFEYMAVKLPVITSDFPLYRDVVEQFQCGYCVDPEDPHALAEAIEAVFTHPEEAKQMGENGRTAIEKRFNWHKEEKKLLQFYTDLLKEKP